jgi:D-glycero-D-manno-heptose 1,7-bisphosphate phosphatase
VTDADTRAPAIREQRPAVFLDRDGTIIHDEHYLSDPGRVAAIPGAAAAIASLRKAGYVIVVVTNQSGLARGMITSAQYEAVRARTDSLFAAAGSPLDATYMCPHHPDVTGPCDCRKPAAGLYRQAARELGLDLGRSTLIGDRCRDIAAATELGANGILVPTAATPGDEIDQARQQATVAPTLAAAVSLVLGQ